MFVQKYCTNFFDEIDYRAQNFFGRPHHKPLVSACSSQGESDLRYDHNQSYNSSGNVTNNFTGRPGLFPMTPPNQIHHDFDIGKSKTNEFIRRHSEISDADQHPDIRRHGCDDIVTEMFPKPEIPRQHSDDVTWKYNKVYK